MQLWALHGGESHSDRLIMIENRAAEVLREVLRCGWEDYQHVCEDAAAAACHLWRKCEVLLTTVAAVDEMDENGLLCRCKQLLTASDLLIASEEEILGLMDIGPEIYDCAYTNGELCWQQNFSGQVY